MVKVNCSALPAELVESEFFGHEIGAFTGAVKRKIGRFELANGGTIFLDEIGDLPLGLQTRLLRVLQESEFERVGGEVTIKVDVRVITATNRNLKEEIVNSNFRQDLYYRLNVFPITCSALRDRIDDIPILVNHFVNKYNHKVNKKIKTVNQKSLDRLMKYKWPGNVRELEHIIERAVILNEGGQLRLGNWFMDSNLDNAVSDGLTTLEIVERDYIIKVLEKTNWKIRGKNGAAEILGMQPTTLESRMKKRDIRR
jgi:transcriptional regulator with GAF, ATPase, and Fis domain